MKQINPLIRTADLWDADGRLGKTLDAMFSRTERDIRGLLVGYHASKMDVVVTGPAQFANHHDGRILISEDLPDNDPLAAAMGRAIQAVFSAQHIPDYLLNLQGECT